MRILVDASPLLLRSAGVKSYVWHWLRALQQQATAGSVDAFPLLNGADHRLDHERSVLGSWSTWSRLAALHSVNIGGTHAIDTVCRGYDVFHASNQVRSAPRKVRLTATLHDMTCWLMPELHTDANVRADSGFARSILKNAAGLIAVSENTRQDAIRVLGIQPSRIQVIYSGVDDRFFNAVPMKRQRPYVLCLGTIEPRKNVDTLIDGWHALPASIREEYELLIAGPAGWKSELTLARLRSANGSIKYLGYVPETDIPALTAGASAFAYVSLYEGFGFPVAQAMASGVPVITSSTSCLPEVAGDAAICVDPRSPSEISGALNRVLSDSDLRNRLGASGRKRAGRYRWQECARKSLDFFQRIANS